MERFRKVNLMRSKIPTNIRHGERGVTAPAYALLKYFNDETVTYFICLTFLLYLKGNIRIKFRGTLNITRLTRYKSSVFVMDYSIVT